MLLLIRLAIFALLLAWVLLPVTVQGWLVLPVWVLVSWLIFITRLEVVRTRRCVWLNQYLAPGSLLQQRLQAGWIAALGQLLLALLLGLLFIVQLLVSDGWFWWLLVLSLLLLVWVEPLIARLLVHQVRREYLPVLTRRCSGWLVAGLLMLVMLLVRLQMAQPWLIDLSWREALLLQLRMQGEPGVLALLIRLSQSLDITWQWLLQNALGSRADSGWLAILAWSALFGLQAALCLAWVQLLTGVQLLMATPKKTGRSLDHAQQDN